MNRYLASNYWDCPIPVYSTSSNDYPISKSECGKIHFDFFFKKRKVINNKKTRNRLKLPWKSMFKWRTMFNKIEWKLFMSVFWFSMWNWFTFDYFFFFFFFFFFVILQIINKIEGLENGEQTILINFYNSLTSKGSLNWNILNDLCDQNGVVCDSSNPKRVTQLYFSFILFIYFYFTVQLVFLKNQ